MCHFAAKPCYKTVASTKLTNIYKLNLTSARPHPMCGSDETCVYLTVTKLYYFASKPSYYHKTYQYLQLAAQRKGITLIPSNVYNTVHAKPNHCLKT